MTNSPSAPFDLNGLYELYGQDTVKELLQMSVDEARGLLVQIGDGIASNDANAVMTAAHQLKGLASTMTITQMAALSLELETAARQGNWEPIPAAKEKLEVEFVQLADYVSKIFAS